MQPPGNLPFSDDKRDDSSVLSPSQPQTPKKEASAHLAVSNPPVISNEAQRSEKSSPVPEGKGNFSSQTPRNDREEVPFRNEKKEEPRKPPAIKAMPEDIFAGLDETKKPTDHFLSESLPVHKSSVLTYVLIALGIFFVVGGSVFAFWYFAIHRTTPVVAPVVKTQEVESNIPPENTEAIEVPTDASATETVVLPRPVVTPPQGVNIPLPAYPADAPLSSVPQPASSTSSSPLTVIDSDQDGLTDERETQLGTDPQNKDTDADLLTDKDEVEKFETNPLFADSDNDTYPDGLEVQRGYNPRGPGKCMKADCTP